MANKAAPYTKIIDGIECMVIALTRGYETIVDMADADLAELNWHASAGGTAKHIYAVRNIRLTSGAKTIVQMHRLILERVNDLLFIEAVLKTDHINRNGLDNRRENLRLATHSQNMANSKPTRNMKGAYRGYGGRWTSYINANSNKIYLGTSNTEQEAHDAYCIAAHKYFGEFARTE